MLLRVFAEPQQGATYGDLLAVARTAEDCGFDGFFRSDHYGIGTGWFAGEHLAYGVPFPAQAERFGRLAEQVEIITGLWRTPPGEQFSYDGEYYQLKDSPALPKPVQAPHPPLIIGGHGPRRTPALAARHAAEFNVPYAGLATVTAQFTRVRAACAAVGRDPASIRLSAVLPLCCGRTDAEVARRAGAQGRTVAELRETGLAGSPAEVADTLGRFAEAGADRIYLSILDLADTDHLALTAAEVLPAAARLRAGNMAGA